MPTPQRTMSMRAAGSASVAAELAACTITPGCSARIVVRPAGEGGELRAQEAGVVLVGGREVGEDAGQPQAGASATAAAVRRGLVGVAGAEAAHAGVELDVHAGLRRRARCARAAIVRAVASRQQATSAPRAQGDVELLGRQRAEHEQRPLDAGGAQLGGLGGGRDRQPGGAGGLRGARGRHRAVPVAVGLDDRAQRRGRRGGREPRAVALDRGDVDAGQRAQQFESSR